MESNHGPEAEHVDPPRPESDIRTESQPTTGAPLWVKVFCGAVAVLVVLVAVMMFVGRGDHGPGRHGGGDGGEPSPASITPDKDGGGHVPPGGGH